MYKVNSLHFDKEGLSEIVVEVFEVDGVIYSSAVARNLELMQFTGLKDKNGKDIYEGDIVIHRYPAGESLYRVEIGENEHYVNSLAYSYMGVHFVCIQSDIGHAGEVISGMGYWALLDELEIIGTIYENPESMKDQPT